jgi:hypothetical protein
VVPRGYFNLTAYGSSRCAKVPTYPPFIASLLDI